MDPPRRPAPPSDLGEGLDAASLELVLRAFGAAAAAEAAPPPRAAPAQRGPEFNWNDDEEAAPRATAAHKDGERSASRGPCKCGFKHWLKGVEYDWVIPIPTTAGMLLLGYNKSEDPYDAAQRFIEEQKVRDSGLLDNSLVANLVEYILACTEAGDEPSYPGAPAPALAPAPVLATAAAAVPIAVKEPSKEELEKREQERLKRERELRAEKERAEAQKLEVKRQIELDKENRRREAEARRKAEEERRALAAQAPAPAPTSSSSSVVSQPSPPSSQPVSPAAPVRYSSTLHPVPQTVPSPWADEDDADLGEGYATDMSRFGFARPAPAPAGRLGGLGNLDRFASLRREQWTMEDVLEVYRAEGQMALLMRLKKAGFAPDELVRLLQYAALMDQAERPLGLVPPAVAKSGSKSPEPRPFGGQGHTLRSSEPQGAELAFRGQGHSLRSSDVPVSFAAAPAPAEAAPAPAAGKPLEAVVVDPAQPKTSIKIRLHTGQQIVANFNHTHTVLDIRRHIEFTCPLPVGAVYELLLPPPGRVVLADHSVTIAKAGLQNATVIQSLR